MGSYDKFFYDKYTSKSSKPAFKQREYVGENLKGKFTRRNQISKYETRRMHDLQIPKPRLELSKRSFSYVRAKVWNDIPYAIRNVKSTHLFMDK